jgi:hypothetical protein
MIAASVGCDEIQGAMRSVTVVVGHILVEDPFEMPPSEDQRPVQAFSPERPDETFRVRVASALERASR